MELWRGGVSLAMGILVFHVLSLWMMKVFSAKVDLFQKHNQDKSHPESDQKC